MFFFWQWFHLTASVSSSLVINVIVSIISFSKNIQPQWHQSFVYFLCIYLFTAYTYGTHIFPHLLFFLGVLATDKLLFSCVVINHDILPHTIYAFFWQCYGCIWLLPLQALQSSMWLSNTFFYFWIVFTIIAQELCVIFQGIYLPSIVFFIANLWLNVAHIFQDFSSSWGSSHCNFLNMIFILNVLLF